ncbi:MAG TPA: hypothetical protein DDY49_15430 [Paenibacillaceae bacterium]|nr:hypothetical protein [Paenibacillaceae bacterium]
MGWALFILFGAAVVLLVLSYRQTSKIEKEGQKVEQVSLSFMDEVYQLQQQIRNLEIDTEIIAQETGILKGSRSNRVLLREVLDLYKRGYSFDSIASKNKLPKNEVKSMLSPYMKATDERGKVAK